MGHTTQKIPDHMLGAHPAPDDADESYQESWGFVWHDPIRKAGGIQHISYQRKRGITDILSWIAYEGKVVGVQRQFNGAPPSVDFPSWTVNGISIDVQDARNFTLQ